MNDYKVSILVPIFRVEKYIEKCANSIFSQNFDSIEYIFVNDCTDDNSMKILENVIKKYPTRKNSIKIVNHKKNSGLAASRNSAIENSSGNYIFHLDSDDYIAEHAIAEMYNLAILEDADVVITNFQEIYPDKIIKHYINIGKSKKQFLRKLISYDIIPVCIWGKLIKRNLYFDFNIRAIDRLDYAEDYSVSPRVFFNAKKIINNEEYYYYYSKLNPNSYIKNFNEKDISNLYRAFFLVKDFFQKKIEYYNYKNYFLLAEINIKLFLIKSGVDNVKLCESSNIKINTPLLYFYNYFIIKKQLFVAKIIYKVVKIIMNV